jgi:MYXO-CTERM domain-containing protein
VDSAGGLSPYGTMGQGGNVWEWNESAFDGSNSWSSEFRAIRGGGWAGTEGNLRSSIRGSLVPTDEGANVGFRVASAASVEAIPEPGTWAAAVLLAGAAGYVRWRRRRAA